MRIVVVSDTARISGGAEKVALTAALALAQRGIETTVLTGVGPVDERLQNVDKLTVENTGQTAFYDVPSRLQGIRQVLWNGVAAERMASILKRHDPNDTVVHFHSYLKVLSGSTLAAALDAGFRVVVTLHDYGLACPNMGFYNYQSHEICRLKPMSVSCVTTNCTLRGRTNKLGFVARAAVLNRRVRWRDRIRHFVAVSQSSGEIMRPFLHPEAKVHLVLNPVDLEKLDPVPVSQNKPLLYVGRLEAHKDPMALAAAAKEVGMPVVFVGDGPVRDEVAAINPDAEITGWVSPDEVHRRQREARALVMPSRWYEGAPLVIFDALAAGLPVVVGDINCGHEFVAHGETGLIFSPYETGSLARELSKLKDDALVASMGKAAFQRFWAAPPTMDKHIEGLLAVYEQALA